MANRSKKDRRSRILELLNEESILDWLPDLEDRLLNDGGVIVADAGQVLAESGKPLDRLWLPLTTTLRLTREEGTHLGFLQSGRTLGLQHLIHGTPIPYAAEAESTGLVIWISRDSFLEAASEVDGYLPYLQLMTQSPGLRAFKRFLSERGVKRDLIISVFKEVRGPALAEGGQKLQDHEGLIFVDWSRWEVSPSKSASDFLEGTKADGYRGSVGTGAWFGGEGLVAPYARSYEAKASRDGSYHWLPRETAIEFLEKVGLIDEAYQEPWLHADLTPAATQMVGTLPRASLPFHQLSPEEAERRGLSWHLHERRAKSGSRRSTSWASLSNLALHHGVQVSASNLRTDLMLHKNLSPLRAAQALEPFGLMVSAIDARAAIKAEQFPLLLEHEGHFFLLLGRSRGQWLILDPAVGLSTLELEALPDAVLESGALFAELNRDEDGSAERALSEDTGSSSRNTKKEAERISPVREWVRDGLSRFKVGLGMSIGLSFIGMLLGVATPLLSQMLLDQVLSLRDTVSMWSLVAGIALVTIVSGGVHLLQTIVTSEVNFRFDYLLSNKFYQRALRLPEKFFAKRKAGDMLTRLNELSVVRDFFSAETLLSMLDLLSIVIYMTALSFYSPRIAMVPLALIPLLVGLRLLFKKRLRDNYRRVFDNATRSQSLLTEQISSIATIKSMGAEAAAREKWEEAMVAKVDAGRRAQLDQAAVNGLLSFISQLANVVGIYVAAIPAVDGTISPGGLLAVTMYLSRVTGPIGNLANLISRWEEVNVSLDKLDEVVEAEPEQRPERAQTALSLPLRGKIQFERVSFRYEEEAPWVLRDLNLTIYPRQTVAIVGRSGCGKTTLAKLIGSALRPTTGRIFVDDYDLSFLLLSSVRSQLGFITQERKLFAGTVKENIAYADDNPPMRRVHQAAEAANAHTFIQEFSRGYEHYLGEGGIGLSGGQQQRLCIARTLYTDPSILIMDEATSALDSDSEHKIISRLQEILSSKTAIIIAHRLSTVRNADRILVMDEGKIVQDGTHDELIAVEGHYATLFENQAA